jgi:hypothetical protein
MAHRARFSYLNINRSAHPFKGKTLKYGFTVTFSAAGMQHPAVFLRAYRSPVPPVPRRRESAERLPVSGPCTTSVFPSPLSGGSKPRIRDRVCNRGSRGVGHGFVVPNRGPSSRSAPKRSTASRSTILSRRHTSRPGAGSAP